MVRIFTNSIPTLVVLTLTLTLGGVVTTVTAAVAAGGSPSVTQLTAEVNGHNVSARPLSKLQSLMDPRHYNKNSTHRWSGSDVDLSTRLNKRYDLFLYGDSLIGTWNESTGARICSSTFGTVCNQTTVSHMPHSTFGIWDRQQKSMAWFWGDNYTSLLLPSWANATTVFWGTALTPVSPDGDSICVIGIQVLFLSDTPMGFRTNGSYAVCLEGVRGNPTNPRAWSQRWSRLPFTGDVLNDGNTSVNWRCALTEVQKTNGGDEVLNNKDENQNLGANQDNRSSFLYLYGEIHPAGDFSTQALVRFPWSALLPAFNWTNTVEVYDVVQAAYAPLLELELGSPAPSYQTKHFGLWLGGVPEFTVTYSKKLQQYFMLYLDFEEYTVKIRTGKTLEGPWMAHGVGIYNLPPPQNDASKVFCYAVKTHPQFNNYISPEHADADGSSDDQKGSSDVEQIVFSYVCNAKAVPTLFEPEFADIYLPQFVALEIH